MRSFHAFTDSFGLRGTGGSAARFVVGAGRRGAGTGAAAVSLAGGVAAGGAAAGAFAFAATAAGCGSVSGGGSGTIVGGGVDAGDAAVGAVAPASVDTGSLEPPSVPLGWNRQRMIGSLLGLSHALGEIHAWTGMRYDYYQKRRG